MVAENVDDRRYRKGCKGRVVIVLLSVDELNLPNGTQNEKFICKPEEPGRIVSVG